MDSVKDRGWFIPPGFPHSEISGSQLFSSSPKLIAGFASFIACWCQGIHQQPLIAWPKNFKLLLLVRVDLTSFFWFWSRSQNSEFRRFAWSFLHSRILLREALLTSVFWLLNSCSINSNKQRPLHPIAGSGDCLKPLVAIKYWATSSRLLWTF